MGTSQSSDGAPSGVPMVPSWADAAGGGAPGEESPGGVSPSPADGAGEGPDARPAGGDEPAASPAERPAPAPVPIAPAGRFSGARRSLGSFARSGSARAMRRGLGQYVRSGYGAAGTAARRFGGTAASAERLHGALSALAAGETSTPGGQLDPVLLAGLSAQEVLDALVEAVRPIDGTQDAEAGRAAMRDALSELLTRYPDADLLKLTAEQRAFAIERYAALDVFRRIDLDLGKSIRDKAPSATAALSRMKQVRDYVKESVAASFRRLREAGRAFTSGRVGQVVRDALRSAFEVFEGYAE